MNDKRCSKCKEYKASKTGGYCTSCRKEYKREWNVRRGLPGRHGPDRLPKLVDKPYLPSYTVLHRYLGEVRGKAAAYVCACGDWASEWAYQHTDPHPIRGYTSRGIPVEYSLDYERYVPMCKSCHARFDFDRNGGTTAFLASRDKVNSFFSTP